MMCLRFDWRSLAHAAHIWRICGRIGPSGSQSEPLVNYACIQFVSFFSYTYSIYIYIYLGVSRISLIFMGIIRFWIKETK